MILFLAKYPQTSMELREGAFQRIISIDSFFDKEPRIYLNITLNKNHIMTDYQNGNRREISCNIFIHYSKILKLFKEVKTVYIHSIFNALFISPLILLFDKFYILDIHGVVTDELRMQNLNLRAFIYSWVERIVFHKASIIIGVTHNMVKHFKHKYPTSKADYLVYAILPTHLTEISEINIASTTNQTVNIIYSGNTQVWQNVDLMLNHIKENLSKRIHYTILTGEPEKFLEKLKQLKIENYPNIILKSVSSHELADYYKKADYGFILRNDNIVNKVACPTKLVEYLAYGIIPIVIMPNIGDFGELGMEYLLIDEFNTNIPKIKSQYNQGLVSEMQRENSYNLKDLIMKKATQYFN